VEEKLVALVQNILIYFLLALAQKKKVSIFSIGTTNYMTRHSKSSVSSLEDHSLINLRRVTSSLKEMYPSEKFVT
jgi:hypothetical protein